MLRILKVSSSIALSVLGGYSFLTFGIQYQQWIYKDRKLYEFFLDPLWIGPLFGILGALIGFLWAYLSFDKLIQFTESLEEMPPRDKVATILGVFLGLIATSLVALIILNSVEDKALATTLVITFGYTLCYLGVTAMMSMRRELLSILPGHVESLDDLQEQHPKLVDTSVIIDGRIADIARTGFIEGPLYVPGFVLDELQQIADSGDAIKRARGRRGLDVLNQMRKETKLVVRAFDLPTDPNDSVDLSLVNLAKALHGAILTTDYNLNKVAELQDVVVLNINELANAMRPVVLPAEDLHVTLIKEGRDANQAVAYLEDGTMVVVENGRRAIGSTVDVTVSSVLQTVAGKMIFAELKANGGAEEANGRDVRPHNGGRTRRKVPPERPDAS